MKGLVIALCIVVVVFGAAFGILAKKYCDLARGIKTANDWTNALASTADHIAREARDTANFAKKTALENKAKQKLLAWKIERIAKDIETNAINIEAARINIGRLSWYVLSLENATASEISRIESQLKAEIAKVDKKALASIQLIRDHTGKKVGIIFAHDKKVKEDAETILKIDQVLKDLGNLEKESEKDEDSEK